MDAEHPQSEEPSARRPGRAGRALGWVLAGTSLVALVALAAAWTRSRSVLEKGHFERRWVHPEGDGRTSRGETFKVTLGSGEGTLSLELGREVRAGIHPETLAFELKLLGPPNQTSWRWERLNDDQFFSDNPAFRGRPSGVLRWLHRSNLRVAFSPGDSAESWLVAAPYWMLMIPLAIPPVWWLWCPAGRAFPRLTLARSMLVTAAAAGSLAGFASLWYQTGPSRAADAVRGHKGDIFYRSPTPPSPPTAWRVDLSDREITDADVQAIASAIRWLPDVHAMRISSPLVTDAGLAALEDLDQLEWLAVVETAVTDAGLAHLKSLPRLASLRLERIPGVTDAGLDRLCALGALKDLTLNCSNVTSGGLKNLGRMTSLERLDLNDTSLTAGEVNALKQTLPQTDVFKYR